MHINICLITEEKPSEPEETEKADEKKDETVNEENKDAELSEEDKKLLDSIPDECKPISHEVSFVLAWA